MNSFKRNFIAGQTSEGWNVWVTINWDGEKLRLSFTGVEGPKSNGDALGGCGQIDVNSVDKELADLWKRWHLNDMRAGCVHQRENWNTEEQVEIISYKLTVEARLLRSQILNRITDAWLKKEELNLTDKELALADLKDWFKNIYQLPNNSLKDCYIEEKRETKYVGWVYPKEHPKGLLCKPCGVCGYKYGSSWLYEEVPEEVLEKLAAYPDQTEHYPWNRYA